MASELGAKIGLKSVRALKVRKMYEKCTLNRPYCRRCAGESRNRNANRGRPVSPYTTGHREAGLGCG